MHSRGMKRPSPRSPRLVYGRFLQVSYRILRDRHLAEDATQQALVRIWRKLPRLRDPARFEAWSYRLLVNACLSEAKRTSGRQVLCQTSEPVAPYSRSVPTVIAISSNEPSRDFP